VEEFQKRLSDTRESEASTASAAAEASGSQEEADVSTAYPASNTTTTTRSGRTRRSVINEDPDNVLDDEDTPMDGSSK